MKTITENRTIILEDKKIDYILLRKNVKNINIRITPASGVVVSANPYVSVEKIEDVLREKITFILKNVERFRNSTMQEAYPPVVENGAKIKLLGKYYPIVIQETKKKEYVLFNGETVVVFSKQPTDSEKNNRLLQKWLSMQTKKIFEKTCRRVYSQFVDYGFAYPEIKVRTMKARWGSAQVKRFVVTLNASLIHHSPDEIYYVAVHEFAHFVQPNHSKKFYEVVKKYVPDYKEVRKRLNAN